MSRLLDVAKRGRWSSSDLLQDFMVAILRVRCRWRRDWFGALSALDRQKIWLASQSANASLAAEAWPLLSASHSCQTAIASQLT
ncbi:hypothetical protein SPAN111604_14860 [Sphingomonas antarctica]